MEQNKKKAGKAAMIFRFLKPCLPLMLTGLFFSIPFLFNAPLFLAGGLKIVYDLLLFREFSAVKPPEESTK